MSDHENGEKGFNDEELADIMNEIENLESELDEGEVVEVTTKKKGSQENENVEEITSVAPVDVNPGNTLVNFEVSGEMKFNLGFVIDGKNLNIYLDGNNGLVVEMDGGVKLNVPLDGSQKKAA